MTRGFELFQHTFPFSLPSLHGESILSSPKVGLGQRTCSGQRDEDRSSRAGFLSLGLLSLLMLLLALSGASAFSQEKNMLQRAEASFAWAPE